LTSADDAAQRWAVPGSTVASQLRDGGNLDTRNDGGNLDTRNESGRGANKLVGKFIDRDVFIVLEKW
jgi:hypothetical protein